MSSSYSNEKMNKSFYHIQNDINLIFIFQDDIIYSKTIDNKKYNLKNIEELEEYIKSDSDVLERKLYIKDLELEENYLAKLIAKYSKKYNKGNIDWRFPYHDISFNKMDKLIGYIPKTIIVKVNPDGMGAAGGMGLIISNLDKLLDFLKNIIKEIRIRKYTYDFFQDNYGIKKDFIKKVINSEFEWKKGCIDTNIYDNKIKYEKKIMKDCNYYFNKKEKKWKKVFSK
ncbi:MAG: hypothetical protein IJG68_00570 [Bacilli bacterium]|nr:hypothetical protein [Bacilli bacterium]